MKIKKRVILLNIGLIIMMIFSFVYITAAGDHYTKFTGSFFEDGSEPSVEVIISDESVLRLDRFYFHEDELVLELSSVGEGKATIAVAYTIGEDRFDPLEYDFEVNGFGTVFETTFGAINFNGLKGVVYAILVQLAMTLAVMVWMFVDYCRKGEFSYPMIACGGLSIYLSILLTYVVYYILNAPIYSFTYFLELVSMAGLIMLLLLSPSMLILSVMLALSNIRLMKHEGYRPVNSLGIVFAVLWFAGDILTVGMNISPFSELFFFIHSTPLYGYLHLPLVYIVGYMECLFLSTVICSFLAARYKPPFDRDYIIILGCAIRGDGTPTPLLKARVDSAFAFAKKQYEQNGKQAFFVPSGGQGPDEVISESESMKNYLMSLGVPAERILTEDKSVNTFQNMQFSKRAIDAHAGEKQVRIGFATTNYHVFRGYILSKKNGFDAKGISAKTKLYFFPNAFLREFIGLIVDQKWKHLFFILLTVAIFTAIKLIQ